MTNLVTLQDKVTAMLEGERKRKEVALKFLDEFEEILLQVAETTWGTGTHPEIEYTCWVKNKKDEKNKLTDLYFRYEVHETQTKDEFIGFYRTDPLYNMYNMPIWGKSVKHMKGADFWDAIRILINWIPVLIEIIDGRNESRNQLISLINIK